MRWSLLSRSFNVSPDNMSLVKSSLCNAVLIVLALSVAVQETAAQSVLCHQYQTFESKSGQYISKFTVCVFNTTRQNLTSIDS